MTMLTEKNVEIYVLVYKDGIAARFGHDLKLHAKSLIGMITRGEAEPFAVDATIDARRVVVECARVNGHDDKNALTASDKLEINRRIQFDVLNTEQHPEIRFTSTHVAAEGENFNITGNLALNGHTHQLHIRAMHRDGRYIASIHLKQTDYGIKPYSAAFGTLKVKPEVVVEIILPGDLATRA